MSSALEFAETGHLCMATLHANSARQAFNRILSMFPSEMEKGLLMQISMGLVGIISQRLVKTVDGGRAACLEILRNNVYISKMIMEGRLDEIRSALEKFEAEGMQTFDMHLFKMFEDKIIDEETALSLADSQNNMSQKINNYNLQNGQRPENKLKYASLDLD